MVVDIVFKPRLHHQTQRNGFLKTNANCRSNSAMSWLPCNPYPSFPPLFDMQLLRWTIWSPLPLDQQLHWGQKSHLLHLVPYIHIFHDNHSVFLYSIPANLDAQWRYMQRRAFVLLHISSLDHLWSCLENSRVSVPLSCDRLLLGTGITTVLYLDKKFDCQSYHKREIFKKTTIEKKEQLKHECGIWR